MDAYYRMLSDTSSSFHDLQPSRSDYGTVELVAGGLFLAVVVPGFAEVEAGSLLGGLAQAEVVTRAMADGFNLIEKGMADLFNRPATDTEKSEWIIDPETKALDEGLKELMPSYDPAPLDTMRDLLKADEPEGAPSLLKDFPSLVKSFTDEPPQPEFTYTPPDQKDDDPDADSDDGWVPDLSGPDDSNDWG